MKIHITKINVNKCQMLSSLYELFYIVVRSDNYINLYLPKDSYFILGILFKSYFKTSIFNSVENFNASNDFN